MNNLFHIISPDGTLHTIIDDKQYSIERGSVYYEQAKKAAMQWDREALKKAIDLNSALKTNSGGKITFEDGQFRYNGAIIDNRLSRRIIGMIGEGYNCDPFIKFMEFCYQNPNPTVIDRLYDFMENNCIMLGENGYIVGYKGVRATGFDWYSDTVLYKVGEISKIPREECDEDSRNTCSRGLHLGSLDYARGWVKDGKLILCQINPKNVTAIPEESGSPKLRCCEMEVLQDVSFLKIDGDMDKTVFPAPQVDVNDVSGCINTQYNSDIDEIDYECDSDSDEWVNAWNEHARYIESQYS